MTAKKIEIARNIKNRSGRGSAEKYTIKIVALFRVAVVVFSAKTHELANVKTSLSG
jgi:hypothetical protein